MSQAGGPLGFGAETRSGRRGRACRASSSLAGAAGADASTRRHGLGLPVARGSGLVVQRLEQDRHLAEPEGRSRA